MAFPVEALGQLLLGELLKRKVPRQAAEPAALAAAAAAATEYDKQQDGRLAVVEARCAENARAITALARKVAR